MSKNELSKAEIDNLTTLFNIIPPSNDKIKSNLLSIPDYLVNDITLDKIEFEDQGVEINCITNSLFWISKRLESKIVTITKNDNIFRYIVTDYQEQAAQNITLIEEILKRHPELKKKILIKTLYGSEIFKYDKSRIISEMPIPLPSDIVVYRKLNHENNDIIMGIIGTESFKENPNIKTKYSVQFNKTRAKLIMIWFDEVWELLSLH